MEITTLHVRGSGGAELDMDVPPDGSHEREAFVQRVASGELVALDEDGDPIDRLALLAELNPADAPAGDGVELDKLTVKELRAYAEEHDIDLGVRRTKAELLEAILDHIEADGDSGD